MPHCKTCNCFLDSERSILEHVEKVHGIHCRLGRPHEAYCENCRVYCGVKHKHASMHVLENHLRKKHDLSIEGASTVSSDNVVYS
mmetsp:Transcript_21438/g.31854  ORF Transcript_21438/g.31854 Transcript_21438/m.31854 type:complete len:85 (+) Transcript_21438:116-370(+)